MCWTCNDASPIQAPLTRRAVLSGMGGLAAVTALSACGGTKTNEGFRSIQPDDRAFSTGLHVVTLGTQAGPPVELERAGISTALIVDGAVYLVDCGRGSTTQYIHAGLRFSALRSIFITHLHADHIADYYNFIILAGSAPNFTGDVLSPIDVYGPGPAGALPGKFGGGDVGTVAPNNPTPGMRDLTELCSQAYAYSSNIFMRDSGAPDPRDLVRVNDIGIPGHIPASYVNTSPTMEPFVVMRDDNVIVSASLVPHGPVFPSFAYRFDTKYGSATFSGDTTYSENLITLARSTDVLLHEAVNVRGATNVPAKVLSHILESHVEVQKVGAVAERADAKQLILTHIGDRVTSPLPVQQWESWAAVGYSGTVRVASDLQHFIVNRG